MRKYIRYFFLLTLLALQCSAPKQASVSSSQTNSFKERMSKIKLTDLDGKPVNLEEFAGKPIFLNFWATWCGPCVSEMSSIEKAAQQLKNDIVFLAVSNESPDLIQSYVERNHFSFNFARLEVSYVDVYVVALPTTMLIDANGELISEETGFRNWSSAGSLEMLQSMLKK